MSVHAESTGIAFGNEVVAARVDAAVAEIDGLIAAELSDSDPVLRETLAPLINQGDQRLRSLFTVLSAQQGPHPDTGKICVSGSAIELVHLATLQHERVVDEANYLSSDSDKVHWDNNMAILAGDYLFAVASRMVSRLGPSAVRIIADTFALSVTGQMRQSRGVSDGEDPIKHYLQVVYEKTACLTSAGGRFGGLFSGAEQEQTDRLARLGGIVGTAIQILDDINDVAECDAGTLPRNAFRDGATTLPVLCTLSEPGRCADRLPHLLAHSSNPDSLLEAAELVRQSPGMTRAKQILHRYASKAAAEITALPDTPGRFALTSLVDLAVGRHRE